MCKLTSTPLICPILPLKTVGYLAWYIAYCFVLASDSSFLTIAVTLSGFVRPDRLLAFSPLDTLKDYQNFLMRLRKSLERVCLLPSLELKILSRILLAYLYNMEKLACCALLVLTVD